ncbi:MAG TPA: KR domain-containing protein [Chlorobaculum sp.]|jgi:NAD(P)-dependent dehydrogenase (short-subunit alcohol dehydrogenase family)|uniref:Oxidoreductase, short-chain dehydrogenase/reductase family n=1 Tax=Chlorobaculum tepidum (strain ATCC 49652 / DSM 12025 / NBRC 103806 / TLS) TaxID=194439 RepID=Q8KAS0_CHLTE|nr:SDR family NAD(P)-dependent oxidoreductase [Chlorobaculum tepidum]AAM73302.1 oxidoreductase, short-chain dehydrogenase/reductase family [Chlorobaculum tepidum TLS]HBU23416.1 KR domain-containing protein [Chlorobaculum sp.]
MNLADSTAVVTGSSSGIGLAICRALLDAGASVFGLSRRETPIAHERFRWLKTDVTVEAEIDQAFEAVFAESGRIDLLVNNAGIGFFRDIESIDPVEWRRLIDTNLTAMFLCTRKVVPSMKAAGRGMIVNIGSVAGKRGIRGGTAYCASKFAVNGFSESLMEELRGFGIRVSCINPGSVMTEFFDHAGIEPKKHMQSDDLAQLIVSLVALPDGMLPDEMTVRPL